MADTVLPDTLSLASTAERYEQFKQMDKFQASVSFFDSVAVYYLTQRTNLRSQIDRSFYHDAGDYFRSDPSFPLLESQVTPMRKTVSPFGLNLGRLNYLVDGRQFVPFEHMPEPDGLMDLDDFPTALDDQVHIVSGPAGQLFGGSDAIASIITVPAIPEESEPKTAFISDAGSFGYSYTRGRYSNRFKSGKRVDMSVGYRDADGSDNLRRDDSYQYYGDFMLPIGGKTAIHTMGHLYNRKGRFGIWQDLTGRSISRERFDRRVRAGMEFGNSDGTSRTEIGYDHIRNGSYTDGSYKTRFNITSHGGYLTREWISGETVWQTELTGSGREYDYGKDQDRRYAGKLSLRRANLSNNARFAQYLSGEWVESFGFLPAASLYFSKQNVDALFSLSIGYTERAPTQNELLKPSDTVVSFFSIPYVDRGNDSLKKERQFIGSLSYDLGSERNAIRLALTGGRISNAVYWRNMIVEAPGARTEFSPINTDVEFTDFSASARLKLGNLMTLNGGGAIHVIDYAHTAQAPYTPEYDFFSSGELHLFWRQKLLHFYAYGEVVYAGPYEGYSGLPMGEEPIINTKLSFRIKQFRFSYHFQNVLSTSYMSREWMLFPGRYTFYNVTWKFLD